MAALSSTQSGNFNSSATWGGATPADGDTFTINRGHKVTVNSDIRTTNGYGDIQLYGKLEIVNNGQFRLNGRIIIRGNGAGGYFVEGSNTTNGFLHMTAGSSIEIRGANADNHGLWMETEQHCQMILQGTQKNLNTNLSAATSIGGVYLPVDNASNWAEGDWVTVFNREEDYRVGGDEGFWVHDVDTVNNRIYIRQFVSPTATITGLLSNDLVVDNAKVFRVGYKIVYGTGSNRQTAEITAIDYNRNRLTTNATPSLSHIGETVYQTGAEKSHVDNSVVRRKATTVSTAISANNTTSVTVGNASDIAVGDVIVIDANNDNDTGWDYNTRHTVSSKSGNTLTLDRNVEQNIKVGSLVHILTRDVKVHAVDESSNTRPFILIERWTSSSGRNRVVILQDVWMKGLGRNTNSTYYAGLMMIGYASRYRDDSSNDGEHIQSRFDCAVFESPNNRSSYTGFATRDTREFLIRNCTSYRVERGYWLYSSNYNHKLFNNYASRCWYATCAIDSFYEPYATVQYFYGTRSDDYGMVISQLRENQDIRHNILLNHEQRPFGAFYSPDHIVFERIYMDGYRSFPYVGDANGKMVFLDSYITKNRWDWTSPTGTGVVYSNYGNAANSDRSNYYRTTGYTQFGDLLENNFEYDSHAEWYGGTLAIWDDSEKAWYCKQYNDANSGKFNSTYVPPNTTVRLSCDVKVQSGFTGTRPYLFAMSHRNQYAYGRWQTAYTGQTSGQDSTASNPDGIYGFRNMNQYSAAAVGAWETKTLTIDPQTKGYFLVYGITTTSTDIREEYFYMRDVELFFDSSPTITKTKSISRRAAVRSGFTRAKKRIGGTRL
jgi:hypothetical protein